MKSAVATTQGKYLLTVGAMVAAFVASRGDGIESDRG